MQDLFLSLMHNEMSEEGQHNLLGVLTELKKYPRIRIVISYRTNSMDNMI